MKFKSLILSCIFIPSIIVIGQTDESDDSQDNSAEASVVSSASVPSVASDGATESNPIVALVRAGVPFSTASSTSFATAKKMASNGISKFLEIKDGLKSGEFTLTELESAFDAGLDLSKGSVKSLVKAVASGDGSAESIERLQNASALAESLLVDSSLSQASYATPYNVGALARDSTTKELLSLLNGYGAFGDNGDELLSLVTPDETTNFVTLSSSSTSELLNYLPKFTGSVGFATENLNDSILDIDLSNITLSPSGRITIASDTTFSLDTLGVLGAVETNGDYDARPSDEFVHIFAAIGDLTISDDLTITNTNDAEDHALVLASSDNVMVEDADITYTGSNLAIAGADSTADSVWLTNSKITAGGNLAVASLGTLNISSTDIVVGNANSETSDPDNVYLYANDLISATNLSFTGSRLDDVYMEAVTLNLTNIDFPASAEVLLRSRDGTLNFNASKIEVGSVNLNNVRHLGISDQALTENNFNISKGAGHIDSLSKFENGSPMMRIRAQSTTFTSATN